jgi:hypothetical protein
VASSGGDDAMKKRQVAATNAQTAYSAAVPVDEIIIKNSTNEEVVVEISNAWICIACTCINLGKPSGPCCMCGTDDKEKRAMTMLDPYQLEEAQKGTMASDSAGIVVANSSTPSAAASSVIDNVLVCHPFGDADFECAAQQFCRDTNHADVTSEQVMCINCNVLAHCFCSENLNEQSPIELEFVVTYKDIGCSGKTCFRNILVRQQNTIVFCILCQNRIKAKKVESTSSKRKIPPEKVGAVAPRKKKKDSMAFAAIIRELRWCAAYFSLSYIFRKVESKRKDERFALIEEQSYGNKVQRVKGAIYQLIDGDNAFASLYNVTEGENGLERTLKGQCCRKDTSSNYISGVHFTAKDLYTFGDGKQMSGRALWEMGMPALKHLKKAMLLVPKLETHVVIIDKSYRVLSYASGKNEEIFLKYIHNGMYAMTQSKGPNRLLGQCWSMPQWQWVF